MDNGPKSRWWGKIGNWLEKMATDGKMMIKDIGTKMGQKGKDDGIGKTRLSVHQRLSRALNFGRAAMPKRLFCKVKFKDNHHWCGLNGINGLWPWWMFRSNGHYSWNSMQGGRPAPRPHAAAAAAALAVFILFWLLQPGLLRSKSQVRTHMHHKKSFIQVKRKSTQVETNVS